jgi:hypothetical protein
VSPWYFFGPALVVSALYGYFAVRVFQVARPTKNIPWGIHQFWFNFVGALAGWAALWVLAPETWLEPSPTVTVTWGSAALAVVAFAGVTGHLPLLFWKATEGVAALLKLARDLLEKTVAS